MATVPLSPVERQLLAEVRRGRHGPLPGSLPLSAEEELVGIEDQVQRAWRRLAYAVRATHDHDAVIAMNRFHAALAAFYAAR